MSSLSPIATNFAHSATQATKEAGQKIGQEVTKVGQEIADEFIQKTGNEAAKGEKKGFLNSISEFFSSIGKHITEFFNKLASFFSSKNATAAETTQAASNAAVETASKTTSQEDVKTATQISKGEDTKPKTPEKETKESTPQATPPEGEAPKTTEKAEEKVSTQNAATNKEVEVPQKEASKKTEEAVTPKTVKEETPQAPASEQTSSTSQHGAEQKIDQAKDEVAQPSNNGESKKAASSKKGISPKKTAGWALLAAAAGSAGKTMSQNPGVRDFAVQGYEGMQNLTHTVQTDYIMPNYNKAWNYTTGKFGNLWSTEHSGLNFSSEGIPLYDNSTQYIKVTMPHSESFGTSYYPHQPAQGLDFLTNPAGQETSQAGTSYWNQIQEYGNKTYNYLMGKTGNQPHTSSAQNSSTIANVSAQNETTAPSFSSNIPTTKTPSPTNTQPSPFTTSNSTCAADTATTTQALSPTKTQGSPVKTSNPTSVVDNKISMAKKPEISHPACDKEDEFFDAPQYQTP